MQTGTKVLIGVGVAIGLGVFFFKRRTDQVKIQAATKLYNVYWTSPGPFQSKELLPGGPYTYAQAVANSAGYPGVTIVAA